MIGITATLALALCLRFATGAAVVRLDPAEAPQFIDIGERGALALTLELQAGWYGRQGPGAAWRLGSRTVTAAELRATCLCLLRIIRHDPAVDLDSAIRERFDIFAVGTAADTGRARFTGYYNPVVEARLAPDSTFRHPLYRMPARPHLTRRQIDAGGALAGLGLEIAWLRDPLARYELQVEGTGTLLLPDGRTVNVQYAGANGYPYTSLGATLASAGLFAPGTVTMDSIRALLEDDPSRMQEWLNRNESYVFFHLTGEPAAGCLGLPLVAGRSAALDPALFPPGLLCWVALRGPETDSGGMRWAGFVINQDRGAAIRGPQRVDLFLGSGPDAASVAGRLNWPGRFLCLVARRGWEETRIDSVAPCARLAVAR